MKNLYKIEDELYIISNIEDVSENCWIITSGKLVQVSYLLSDEVAKGFKVILTTNKSLIKDGVQAIDDEFLNWFVKNPSCEEVVVETVFGKKWKDYEYYREWHKNKVPDWAWDYKIIIPKEEPEQFEDEFEMQSRIINKVWDEEESKQEFCDNCNNNICCCIVKKQETFEEAAERRYGTDMDSIRGSSVYDLNTDLKRGFINGAEWQAERSYSEEDIINAIHSVELKDNKNYTKIYAGMKEHLDKLKTKNYEIRNKTT